MSKTVTEHLRERLLKQAGIIDAAPFAGMTYDQIYQQECMDGFTELLDNRLVMGFLRYGNQGLKPVEYFTKRVPELLDDYIRTGNTEYLVDAANFCRLAFRYEDHPNKHFHAVDRE